MGIQQSSDGVYNAQQPLLEVTGHTANDLRKNFTSLLEQAVATKEWMVEQIYDSRLKDYQNEFRKMIYDNDREMEEVIGKFEDNVFIKQQQEGLQELKQSVSRIIKAFRL